VLSRVYGQLNQIYSRTRSCDVDCPFCGYPLGDASPSDRETHVNTCLGEISSLKHSVLSNPSPEQSSRPDRIESHSADDDVLDPEDDADYDFTYLNGQADDDTSVQSGWEGPARPGGWSGWVSRTGEKGDRWWDPVEGDCWGKDIPSNFSPGASVFAPCTKARGARGNHDSPLRWA
jgi:hypothetical protein